MRNTRSEILRGNYVLLRAGALRLVLPQADVAAASHLERTPGPGEIPGLLTCGGGGVYAALSQDMTLLVACPVGRFIAAEFPAAAPGLLWCWDELQVLIDVQLQPVALPDSLLAAQTPVRSWVELDDEPAFLCSAHSVCDYTLGLRS
jgi:hypothetical protein